MINLLQAAEAVQQPGMGSFWIMMLAMVAVMYFFMWRPESKRRKEMTKFREGQRRCSYRFELAEHCQGSLLRGRGGGKPWYFPSGRKCAQFLPSRKHEGGGAYRFVG